MDIDKLAEAMADADDGIIFGLLTPDEAEFYRRMARAAVDSLELTQEWGVGRSSGGQPTWRLDKELCRERVTFLNENCYDKAYLMTRWVTPGTQSDG